MGSIGELSPIIPPEYLIYHLNKYRAFLKMVEIPMFIRISIYSDTTEPTDYILKLSKDINFIKVCKGSKFHLAVDFLERNFQKLVEIAECKRNRIEIKAYIDEYFIDDWRKRHGIR